MEPLSREIIKLIEDSENKELLEKKLTDDPSLAALIVEKIIEVDR